MPPSFFLLFFPSLSFPSPLLPLPPTLTVVIITHIWDYTKNHWTEHFTWMNWLVCELYLNKSNIFFKKWVIVNMILHWSVFWWMNSKLILNGLSCYGMQANARWLLIIVYSGHSFKFFIQWCLLWCVQILFAVFLSWELHVLGLISNIDDFYVVQTRAMSWMLPFKQNSNMTLFHSDSTSSFIQFSPPSETLVSKPTLFIQFG